NYNDCGLMLFDRHTQDVHAGGSGCGCAASVLCGHILPMLASGELQNVLFTATGALMSTTTSKQGESIPGIAHLLHLTSRPTS
ncbi:MAG: stage V sporulation protein AD, partial [Clostridia bacterium]|nr:stage V sporulation protein AD [Clostridia bacterium]